MRNHQHVLEGIRERVDRLREIDGKRVVFGADRHHYALGPPLSDAEIEGFERAHGVELPEELRAFLTDAGSDGAGPYYGLAPLPAGPPPGEQSILAAPFIGDHTKDAGALRQPSASGGCLVLADHGCGYRSVLVLSGSRRGEVFADMRAAVEGFQPEARSFLAWYDDWLNRALAEWAESTLLDVVADSEWRVDPDIEAAAPLIERRADPNVRTAHDGLYPEALVNRVSALLLLRIYQRRFDDASALVERVREVADEHADARAELARARIFGARGLHKERLDAVSVGLAGATAFQTKAALLREKGRSLHALGQRSDCIATLLELAALTSDRDLFYDAAWMLLEDGDIDRAVHVLADLGRRGMDAEALLSALVADGREALAEEIRSRCASF